jgi:ankyrin repeat protein
MKPRSAGADANKAAYGGCSPLHVASDEGHLQVIRQLVEGRARIDGGSGGSGGSALHSAVQKGHISVAQCLLETWM